MTPRAGARHALLLWGGELSLARLSGVPQAWLDVLASAAFIGALIATASWLAQRPGPAAGRLGGAIARLPLAVIAVGIAAPAARHLVAGVMVAGVAAVWVARGSARARRGLDPMPDAGMTLAALGGAAALAWGLATGLPPAWMAASVVAAWSVLVAVTSRAAGVLPAAVCVLILARAPGGDLPRAGSSAAGAGAPAAGPDLILISVDTLRADAAETMESFGRLAERGLAFSAAQAPAPWTLPSMATLFTGLPVSAHGAGQLEPGRFAGLPIGVPTLAERLSAAGYDTVAVVAANPFLGAEFGVDRGFARFYHASAERRFGLPRWIAAPSYAIRPAFAHLLTLCGILALPAQADADALVDAALQLAAEPRDRPLFLWLHLLDPHLPYVHAASAPFAGSLRRSLIRAEHAREMAADPRWASEAGIDVLRTAYAAEVAAVDAALLRLLAGIGPAVPGERIWVFTSDHGEEFFEHGGFEHGHAFYQEVLRVPLVIAGIPPAPGTAPDAPVGLVDVAPTLLRAVGIAPDGLPGRDVLSAASEDPYVSRNLLYPRDETDAESYALRRGRWKVIVREGVTELYDLVRDPLERDDLAERRPDLARRLADAADAPAPRGLRVELEASERDALRALGYLPE